MENTLVQLLNAACIRYASKTLPRVLLYSQVNMMVTATAPIAKLAKEPIFMFGSKNNGRWNRTNGTLRITLETRALYFACNFGRAKPRQASSSPLRMPRTKNVMVIIASNVMGLDG